MADARLDVATRVFDDQFYRTQADRIAHDHDALLGSRRGVRVRGRVARLTFRADREQRRANRKIETGDAVIVRAIPRLRAVCRIDLPVESNASHGVRVRNLVAIDEDIGRSARGA